MKILQGKFIKFRDNGIEVDPEQLSEYLSSEASTFPIRTVMDFFETLHVLQFSKSCGSKNKVSYYFVHPNFGKDKALSDEFYKQAINMSCKELKGTKRMSPMHHIELFDRLIRMNNSQKVKITRLEFARLKLQYVLQRKIDLMKYEADVVDHNIEEPDYKKNNEIAGYYGDVEIGTLQKVFCNYFPIYQNTVEEPMEVDQPTEAAVDQVAEQPMDNEIIYTKDPVDKIQDTASQEIIIDVCSLPEVKLATIEAENKENEPPAKKRRKYKTRPGKVSIKETNEALAFLQQEFGGTSSDI